MIPFSFGTIPKDTKDYIWSNNFVGASIYLKLEEKLKDAIKVTKQASNSVLKKYAGAFFIVIQLYSMFFPHKTMSKFLANSASKHTVVFTNVPGFTKPISFGGGKIKE